MAFYRRNNGGICANPNKTLFWKKNVIKKHLKKYLTKQFSKKKSYIYSTQFLWTSAFYDLQ
jgi:hypothetical protein